MYDPENLIQISPAKIEYVSTLADEVFTFLFQGMNLMYTAIE